MRFEDCACKVRVPRVIYDVIVLGISTDCQTESNGTVLCRHILRDAEGRFSLKNFTQKQLEEWCESVGEFHNHLNVLLHGKSVEVVWVFDPALPP